MGSVIILLFCVIKWTLATTKEIMKQSAIERESWIKALTEHTQQAKTFHEEVKDAHNFQRVEHQEMIKVLGRINGYKDTRE